MAAWNAHNANEAALSFDYDVEYFDASVGQSQYGGVPCCGGSTSNARSTVGQARSKADPARADAATQASGAETG
ncbi:MAG: hypothetical protein GZ093_06000 [Rhodoferax sp.]|uniref:hypothetical protein n=1 Tax=Rhodoferax sp. TaxID=50421 RepID=UPI0013FF3F61|nr:hypothetical protein [Rhodoferax sp.]NDP38289.1 hypothetical protein [Rhodoferax sp.]